MRKSIGALVGGYLLVAAAACCMSLSYVIFVFPNSFAPAGLNGLATMAQYLFGIHLGYLSLLINLPLILLAWRWLNRDFAGKSLLFVLVFSGMVLLLERADLPRLSYRTEYSPILGPAVAGILSGAVYGVVLRQNGSTGGTDIAAAWIRKKRPEASLVWVIFGLNASVAALSFFVYGYQVEPVILCLLYCYLSSSVSDGMLKGCKSALKYEVITCHAPELSEHLMRELHHGVTMVSARGMYSNTPRQLLICVVNRHQVARFRRILEQFPDTFAYTASVTETLGNFKRISN